MTEIWVGAVVTSKQVVLVEVEVGKPLVVLDDSTWQVQDGNRANAYLAMFERMRDFISTHNISKLVLKASAGSQTAATQALLEAAELRGVVQAAAVAGGAVVQCLKKAIVSRTFGERKFDEYLKDDVFWSGQIAGSLRRGSREAALLLVAAGED